MRKTTAWIAASAMLIGGAMALAASGATAAESVMKQCGQEWKAAKAAGTTGGQTWQDFLKTCRTQKEGAAGYELALNFNGLAFELIPRSASEIKGKAKFQLLSVNEAEYHKNPGRRLVAKRGARWELTSHGLELLDMLTY